STVTGSFCGSVVANKNLTCSGGSSRVFNSALKLLLVSMCTSSIKYTLYLPCVGEYWVLSSRSRIESTPVCEAASISIKSKKRPWSIDVQIEHVPQGSELTPLS